MKVNPPRMQRNVLLRIRLYNIVSKRKDNPLELDGKPVKIFDDIEGNIRRKGLVVISQNYASNDEMMKILYQEGFKNILSSAI